MKALISCLFILTLYSVSAQESYFGIKTGYAMPQMNGNNESTIDMESFHSSTFGLVICSEFDNSPLGLTFSTLALYHCPSTNLAAHKSPVIINI